MFKVNELEDLETHRNLKFRIYKKKMMNEQKLKGVGFFGIAGLAYAYYPYVVASLGQTWTTSLMTAACLSGMYMMRQNDPIISAIGIVPEDSEEFQKMNGGNMVNFNYEAERPYYFTVSDNLLTSRVLYVNVANINSQISLNNDDIGEDDIDSNYINLHNFRDTSTGEIVESESFLLPSDAFRDNQMIDWLFSLKVNNNNLFFRNISDE